MTTITQIRNVETGSVIVLNTEMTKLAQFKAATEQGFNAGKTSFTNLVNGKIAATKGWVFEIVENMVKTGDFNAIEAILDIAPYATIKQDNTQTYATVNVPAGRISLSALKNGKFSVRFFQNKGVDAGMVAAKVGRGEVKASYIKMGKLTATELNDMVETLA